jgi:predicted metal-binding membrane protein
VTPDASRSTRNPLQQARVSIGVALALLTAAAWALLIWQRSAGDHAASMSPTMGMGALLFLGLWLAMVAAMMFPAIAPMILMFARVTANRRASGRPSSPTPVFVTGYVLVWAGIGLVAFVLGAAAERVADRYEVAADDAGRVAALLIVIAGGYQFSGLKDRCMTECRSPLSFISRHWREGARGAMALGVRHGLVCVGCCWALMALMVPLGMANIAALGAVTLLISAEKLLSVGRGLRYAAGVALVLLGLAAFVHPDLLPGSRAPASPVSGHMMPMGDMSGHTMPMGHPSG